VFAQLITPDGKCHGLHNFLVPVRDPVSHTPYPGIQYNTVRDPVSYTPYPSIQYNTVRDPVSHTPYPGIQYS